MSFAVVQRHSQRVERKVHAMTMDVLLKMDQELQKSPRRKMADFAMGDRIEGVVKRDLADSVHLDIGAAVDGILEKADFLGAADRFQRYLPGTRLNVTIQRKANHAIFLRLHRYEGKASTCQTCGESLGCFNLGRRIPPLFEKDGKRYHSIVGAVPSEVQRKVRALIAKGNEYWDTWIQKSSRPTHRGRLHGVGLQLSINDLMQQQLYGCQAFRGPKPTWKEAAERLIYIAHNMRRIDFASIPTFGDISAVFNTTNVQKMVVIAPYDTGQYGMSCKREGVPKGFQPPELNCSSWRGEVLGTLDRNAASLFGTADGRRLQLLAQRRSWPLFWGMAAVMILSFPGQRRFADPVVGQLSATGDLGHFEELWTQMAHLRSTRSAADMVEDQMMWQQLSKSQLLVEPLKASNPCPNHCVARALVGPCVTWTMIVGGRDR
eukprot:Skav222943  [mRNA]  locus=scaffold1489:530389:540046:- [translate_table: standard]